MADLEEGPGGLGPPPYLPLSSRSGSATDIFRAKHNCKRCKL